MFVLGVDPGGRRLGLAVGDTTTGVAVPLQVVEVATLASSVEAICHAARRRGACLVVIGLPTDVDGAETAACRRSRVLAEMLQERGLATTLQPEVLTSDEARSRARLVGRRRGVAIDDLAAQVLLEEYLNRAATADRPP